MDLGLVFNVFYVKSTDDALIFTAFLIENCGDKDYELSAIGIDTEEKLVKYELRTDDVAVFVILGLTLKDYDKHMIDTYSEDMDISSFVKIIYN